MNDPQLLDLDFCADDTLSGFRLTKLEVFNWAPLTAGSGRCNWMAKTGC